MGHVGMVVLLTISAVWGQGLPRRWQIRRSNIYKKKKHLESHRVSYEKCTKQRLYSKQKAINQQQSTTKASCASKAGENLAISVGVCGK